MPSLTQLKKGQSDPTLKEEGVWSDLIVPDVAAPLKLRLRSVASNAARMWDIARFKKQRNFYLNDNVPPIEVIDQNDVDKLAEVLVLDWNVTNDDGTPTPCTVDAVRAVMAQLPDTRRDALAEAAKHNNYRQAEVLAIAKNSETPSSRDSVTVAEGA
jgi:hypothetical protein